MWLKDTQGKKAFRHGHVAFNLACKAATACADFRPDVEEEWVADEERSCYNCRLRRWTAESFVCLLPA
jgi:hypothetical protein